MTIIELQQTCQGSQFDLHKPCVTLCTLWLVSFLQQSELDRTKGTGVNPDFTFQIKEPT